MKIVIAPDSFKESMSALEVARAIEEGFKEVLPNSEYVKLPMADGGEGTVQSIIDATGGTLKELTVTGPLQEPVAAFYGLSGDKKIAIIEMAASSGLDKVQPNKRNPLKTTSFGFGELIKDALDEGVEEILLGIGGSATNDGGAGMIMSLGGKLLDKNKNPIVPNGEGLKELSYIDISNMHSRINEVSIRVACDVDNPLTGETGASYIYGPQKGGTIEQLKQLDTNLSHFAQLIKESLGKDIEHIPGAGAAGGLGAGIVAFLNGKLERGGDLIVDILDLEGKIKEADLVITGEGGINHQTIFGKTPIAVSQVSKKYGVPTIALAGCLNKGYETIYDEGIDAVFSIIPEFSTIEEALENGFENLKNTAMNCARLINIGMK
ncbi:glycerate kinase [Marinilactibacillus psychrotolerans]|uniref:glycerate kinase n=1 Tax=Marinilactibacillus TaxID=191769 RepID=UPI00090BBE5F|nr:glycerate kinase [Marinilactibacillus sp. 15R]API89801.1 glycerate kinase [Marinilactibacillus sp. 15R]